MKRAPDNILQWNDLQAYPAFRPAMSRTKRILIILAVLAVVVGVLAAVTL